ncbi:hypothetical protein V1520DRAFT_207517 [Lipomyces starkeyi]
MDKVFIAFHSIYLSLISSAPGVIAAAIGRSAQAQGLREWQATMCGVGEVGWGDFSRGRHKPSGSPVGIDQPKHRQPSFILTSLRPSSISTLDRILVLSLL